jgi:hypothetical protein
MHIRRAFGAPPGIEHSSSALASSMRARSLAFLGGPQNAIDACLIASAVSLQPSEHVRVQTDGELLFGRRLSFRYPFVERLVEPGH